MKNHLVRALAPAVLLCASSAASAQDAPAAAEPATAAVSSPRASIGSVGLGVGTNGLMVDYAYGINRWLDVRAGFNFGSYSRDSTEDDIEYEGKLKFSGGKLLLDIKPFAGGFRISTGLYTTPPELELEADGQDDYEIGDREYRGDLSLDGDIDLGSSAPYLGIGWGGTTNTTGFGVSFDVGVMFADSPKVGLDVTGRACDATANSACDPNGEEGFDVNGDNAAAQEFQAELDREIAELEDDAKDFDLWPVIQLALHYRF